MIDIYGHMRQMGQSIQALLGAHFSSNSINHDQLEQQIEFNRNKLADHETKLDQASQLIGDLRASEAKIIAGISDLQVNMAAGAGTLPPGSGTEFVTAIATAVASAIRKPDGDENWAGVAGSRLFTQRVKEYRGPASEFASWAQTFKSNIPKPMREAVEWAETQKTPIDGDAISAHSLDKWNEEVWRCLAGILKGNAETLLKTLHMGEGLELCFQSALAV